MRNNATFKGYKPDPIFCLKRINLSHSEFLSVHKEKKEHHPISSRANVASRVRPWTRPPQGVQKCNTDAALNKERNKAMGGIVFRNHLGELTFGATKKLFTSKPIVAEALVLREASLIAVNMNIERVVFESDNLQLIEACRKQRKVGSIHNIVLDIQKWKSSHHNWSFTWTGRDGNNTAHSLAQMALKGSLPPYWYLSLPPDLHKALSKDKNESLIYRARTNTNTNRDIPPPLTAQRLVPTAAVENAPIFGLAGLSIAGLVEAPD